MTSRFSSSTVTGAKDSHRQTLFKSRFPKENEGIGNLVFHVLFVHFGMNLTVVT